jgi:uncharacterized protein
MVLMPKLWHEIRDPIHIFVRLHYEERDLINTLPFQRLRYIHQLALTYLVYPGATHKRFEHSLGVMELASRVYDIITRRHNFPEIEKILPEIKDEHKWQYWRKTLRVAALCHDVGHLPFSHAAERELLPAGWNHEALSAKIIRDSEITKILKGMKIDPDDVVKLALGPKKATGLLENPIKDFSSWETILAEIIVGDAFGVDRMDYLLRDSHHIGVAYGKFDHFRLIDTLCILPSPPSGSEGDIIPRLGVEEGGIQSSEALMVARYLIYSQVYFHHVRRIYDIHLKDFLSAWLDGGRFKTDISSHLSVTDDHITAAFIDAACDSSKAGHDFAKRLFLRNHFRVLSERNPGDVAINPESGTAIFKAAQEEFGSDNVRHDRYTAKGESPNFPVLMRDGQVVSALSVSDILSKLPVVSIDYVFVNKELLPRAEKWLKEKRSDIIKIKEEPTNG